MTASIGLTSTLLSLVLYVWTALALSAVFRKSGEDAWKAWVPILNEITVLRLGGFSGWFLLFALVPVFGWIVLYAVHVLACHRINVAFGLGGGMTMLAALLFPVWASVLGFGSARWLGHPEDIGGPARTPEPDFVLPPRAPASAGAVYGDWAATPAPAAAPPAGAPAGWPNPGAGAPLWSAEPAPAPPTIAVPVASPSAPAPRMYDQDVDDLEVSAIAPAAVPPQSAATAARVRRSDWEEPDEDVVSAARPPAHPDPVASDPPMPAPEPLVTRVPSVRQEQAPEPWAPRRSPMPESHSDTTDEVSAVAGAPMAGSPRSALGAVSALYARPGIPEDDALDETIIARRRRVDWELVPPIGKAIDITSDVVIIGRRPSGDAAHPAAQLIPIADETRTVSKTHARLELRGEHWVIIDLGSTNGVLLPTLMGTELEAQPGVEVEAGERFFLGDAEVRLRRSGA